MLKSLFESGVVAGYPVVGHKGRIKDGSFHTLTIPDAVFQVAASYAVKDALKLQSPVILQPIMDVQVEVPENYMGDVIGDLNFEKVRSRKWKITLKVIRKSSLKFLPWRYVRYAIALRSSYPGSRYLHDAVFGYSEVPKQLYNELVEKSTKRKGVNKWLKKNLNEISLTLMLVQLDTLTMVKQR